MRSSLKLRGLVPMLAVGALAVSALVAVGSTQASAATAKISKDAAISNTGKVVLPTAVSQLAGTRGFAGASVGAGTTGTLGTKAGTSLATPNSIIGTDNRSLVNPTTTFPARAVGLITQNGGLFCTGWLISKNTILTAGHCVYSGGAGGTWYSNLAFKAGSNGGTAPYGTCTPSATYVLNGWYNSADTQYDAGIIKLNCTVGSTVGWFGMWWQSASLNNLSTTVQGYPGDKPSTQWQSFDYVRATETELIYYQNDTVGGESGSPVWQNRGTGSSYCVGQCAMAIHTNGVTGVGNGATNNHGTRITQAKFNTFVSIANS